MEDLTIEQEIASGQAILLDVRTESEWNDSHSKLAQLFDSARIEKGEFPEIDKSKKIFVHCRSGGRAGRVKSILEQNGFTKVTNIGGLSDLQRLELM